MTDDAIIKAPKGAKSPVPPLPPRVPTIDITPTWRGMLPVLLAVLENGSDRGHEEAARELRRMADLADTYVKIATHYPDVVRSQLDTIAQINDKEG